MNKMLVAVFNTEAQAEVGLQALRKLHSAGDITLYATGVMSKDGSGAVSVRKTLDEGASGTVTGLAVGSLIGLLGGPVGLMMGAAAGTVVGAVRDFWVAGVGLDFVEEAAQFMKPGTVALVAEIEEEWIVPVDVAMEAAGGQIFRRSRSAVAEAQFDHDISALQAEVKDLEDEASDATGAAKARVQARLAAVKGQLDAAVHRAQQRVDSLKLEADAKAEALKLQLNQTSGDVKKRIEERVKRVKHGYHTRGAKLSQAWSLTKEALAG